MVLESTYKLGNLQGDASELMCSFSAGSTSLGSKFKVTLYPSMSLFSSNRSRAIPIINPNTRVASPEPLKEDPERAATPTTTGATCSCGSHVSSLVSLVHPRQIFPKSNARILLTVGKQCLCSQTMNSSHHRNCSFCPFEGKGCQYYHPPV